MHLEQTVKPKLDYFVSKPGWESICIDYIKQTEQVAVVGPWWGTVRTARRQTEEREVDAVALDPAGKVIALASCKWTNSRVGLREEKFLAEMEDHIPGTENVRAHYFFSRNGFDKSLISLAKTNPDRYRLITPQDIYT